MNGPSDYKVQRFHDNTDKPPPPSQSNKKKKKKKNSNKEALMFPLP